MPPTPESTTWTWTSDCRQTRDLVLERLERAGHVRLEHEVEVLEHAAAGVLEDRRERAGALRAARLRLALEPEAALAGELARLAVVLDHAHVLARLGDGVEAEHLDRLGGRRLLDLAALVVVQRAHASPVGAGHERVAPDLEGAAVDEHGDHGATARVELGLDDDARGLGLQGSP